MDRIFYFSNMVRSKLFLHTFLLLFLPIIAWATHNRAGEITYEQLDDLTVRVTITLYTQTSSQSADRDSLPVLWGDGTMDFLPRINGEGEPLPNDVKLNYYVGIHTYPGRGTYTVSMTDPNRVANILNVDPPRSVEIPFYIETTFTLLNPIFNGINNSAVMLAPPLEYACLGQVYTHNPNAFDPDGDSLAYEWTIPKQAVGSFVPNYFMPDLIEPGANNIIELDERTGTITWNAPQLAGIYNIAFKIKEYRNGVLLNEITRDMQIIVEPDCEENRPPILRFDEQVCVEAPDSLIVPIFADDPDRASQNIRLNAIGGPLNLEISPAIFRAPSGQTPPPVEASFEWNIRCHHVRLEAYDVLIRAVDDFTVGNNTEGLATVRSLRIQVVGPPPENVTLNERATSNEIRWDRDYPCAESGIEDFRGFVVWRKENEDGVVEQDCNTDLEAQGYEVVGFRVMEATDFQYFFVDESITPGQTYCYRVTGLFAGETEGGQLFNITHSRPSNFACSGVRTDVPFITKASVERTDEEQGQVEVEWKPPFERDFDTNVYVPPYRFELFRNETERLDVREFQSYGALPESFTFLDEGINTVGRDNEYFVGLYSGDNFVGSSSTAKTMFLEAENTVEGVRLTWTNEVPWVTDSFQILRLNTATNVLERIGTTRSNTFLDRDVERDSVYCYKIQSFSRYIIVPIDGIVNFSQETCLVRKFDFPPCDPYVIVRGDCDDGPLLDSFEIHVEWELRDCPELLSDIVGYNVYFLENGAENRVLINNSPIDATQFTYRSKHGTSGCFYVSAVNSAGLESPIENFDCFENDLSCVHIELPNTFTPNGDGRNDVFRPINFRFINTFRFEVFNRWGNKVFSTTDIQINWDGTDDQGNEVQPGVYFYECNYGYRELNSEEPPIIRTLTGFIELIK